MTESAVQPGGNQPGRETTAPTYPWYAHTWVRLAVCFVFVTTVPLVVTAIYTTQRHVEVMRSVAAATALERANQAAHLLEEKLYAARSDLQALAAWPIWESYQSANGIQDRGFWRDKLGVQLRTFADLKPLYQSLVYTDEGGADIIRVVRRGTVTMLPHKDQQLTPVDRTLLASTIQLAPRQTFWKLTPSDGGLQMTCASRTASHGSQDRSAVWLELDGASLLAECAAGDTPSAALALYDDHGALRFPKGTSCPDTLPANPPRQFVDATGRLVSLSTVSIFPGQSRPNWRLSLLESASVLNKGVHDFRAAFLSLLGAALLVAMILSVWLARQFSGPLRRMYQASQRIGRGEFDVHLGDVAGDEMGALAHQIDFMADQLRAAHQDFERRLSQKTEQLVRAERLSTIGRTAAAVAHEINNPSGIISLYSQMLAERLPADDPNREKLLVIKSKAREISRIVNELLDYSRNPAPKKEWVDARRLITRALDDVRALQSEGDRARPISQEITVDAERVFVDPHLMGRVLRNVINNACQAMPSGGTLSITIKPVEQHGIAIGITDTGTGMDAEQLQHLFDPFYSTKRFGAGTGLGLAISKEIAERHGGNITVQSECGRGTTVRIWIPAPSGTNDQ